MIANRYVQFIEEKKAHVINDFLDGEKGSGFLTECGMFIAAHGWGSFSHIFSNGPVTSYGDDFLSGRKDIEICSACTKDLKNRSQL